MRGIGARLYFLICLLVTILTGTAVHMNAQNVDQALLSEVKSKLSIPVLSYVLIKEGEITAQEDIGSKSEEEALFRVGSIGKTIVALGVMRLVEQNRLDLDAEVENYLPHVTIDNPFKGQHPLQLRHLLNHTSGLDDMHFRQYYSTDGEISGSLSDVLPVIEQDLNLRWQPGSSYGYSNLNYFLAAFVLEKVTGQDAGKWLQDSVLAPLGMTNSYFDRGEKVGESRPLEGNTYRRTIREHTGLLYPSVGLVSSGNDMGKLVAFFAKGRTHTGRKFLSEESLNEMSGLYEKGSIKLEPLRAGYGIEVLDELHLDTWMASGGIEGSTAWLKVNAVTGDGYAILVNKSPIREDVKYDLETALNWEEKAGPSFPCKPNQAASFEAGYYRRCNPRNELFRVVEDLYGGLTISKMEGNKRLYNLEDVDGAIEMAQVCDGGKNGLSIGYPVVYFGMRKDGTKTIEISGRQYAQGSPFFPKVGRLSIDIMYILFRLMIVFLLIAIFLASTKRVGWKAISLSAFINLIPYWATYTGFEMLTSGKFYELGHFGWYSFALLLLSCMVPIATVVGILWVFKMKGVQAIVKGGLLIQSTFNLGMVVCLAAYGFLPFASWLY